MSDVDYDDDDDDDSTTLEGFLDQAAAQQHKKGARPPIVAGLRHGVQKVHQGVKQTQQKVQQGVKQTQQKVQKVLNNKNPGKQQQQKQATAAAPKSDAYAYDDLDLIDSISTDKYRKEQGHDDDEDRNYASTSVLTTSMADTNQVLHDLFGEERQQQQQQTSGSLKEQVVEDLSATAAGATPNKRPNKMMRPATEAFKATKGALQKARGAVAAQTKKMNPNNNNNKQKQQGIPPSSSPQDAPSAAVPAGSTFWESAENATPGATTTRTTNKAGQTTKTVAFCPPPSEKYATSRMASETSLGSYPSFLTDLTGSAPDGSLPYPTIVGVAIGCIVADQVWLHFTQVVVHLQFPPLLVVALMLGAFFVGLQLDALEVAEYVGQVILGRKAGPQDVILDDGERQEEVDELAVTARTRRGARNPLARVMRHAPKIRRGRGPKQQQVFSSLRPSARIKPMRIAPELRVQLMSAFRPGRKAKESTAAETASLSSMAEETDSVLLSTQESGGGSSALGGYNLTETNALSMVSLDPIFELRGMDLFLTDDAEAQMGDHPFLLNLGLRDCPTFMVNVMTQWGTILLYFEMPSWVTDLGSCLEEQPEDDNATIALKRFLAGTDEYRQQRLKVMPCIVEAPYAVKLLAPKGKELVVHRQKLLNTTFVFYDAEIDAKRGGCKCCPMVEVTLDLIGNSAIRSMSGLVKKNLKKMCVEFGIIISQPLDQTEPEPGAVLGMWRFDHVDIEECSEKPERGDSSVHDTQMAKSIVMALDAAAMSEITA